MSDKNYVVSKESLEELLYHAGVMFENGTFIQGEYQKQCTGDFRREVISDGVFYRLEKHYREIYRLVNVICNDDKITGKLNR